MPCTASRLTNGAGDGEAPLASCETLDLLTFEWVEDFVPPIPPLGLEQTGSSRSLPGRWGCRAAVLHLTSATVGGVAARPRATNSRRT